jgi:hypothetical protein
MTKESHYNDIMIGLDYIEKVLIISTASPIKEFDKRFFEKKREEGYYILSFSSSIIHMYNINFVPDGWTFIDPTSWISCVNKEVLAFMQDKVDLLIFDLYHDNGKEFKKNRMGSQNHPLSNKILNDFNKFKNVYAKKNNFLIEIGVNQNCYINWREDLPVYIGASSRKVQKKRKNFRTSGNLNTDKLACFLLPMVIHYMRNLKEITALCFWMFRENRILGKGVRDAGNSYEDCKVSIEIMEQEIKQNLLDSKIKLRRHSIWDGDLLKGWRWL